MFTDKSRDIMDACRFCWMCRHVCPVAYATGNEANTPRARGLVLSMDQRGVPFSGDSVDMVYQCCLCGACTNDCVTGYDPMVFTREARSQAVAQGLLPAWLQKMVDGALAGNSSFANEQPSEAYRKLVEQLPRTAGVLVYRGGYSVSAMPIMQVLHGNGVVFTTLPQEVPTGAWLGDLVGYVDEVRQVAAAWVDAMDTSQAQTVVVLNPTDAAFIKDQMPVWGLVAKAEVITATAYIARLLDTGVIRPVTHVETRAGMGTPTVTFQDPAHLARTLNDTTSARRILQSTGVELKEMFLNGKLARSCGSAVLAALYPAIATLVVGKRWDDVRRTGSHTLVTASPEDHQLLCSAIPDDMDVVDIFSLLLA